VTLALPVRADKTDFLVNDDGSPAEQNYPRIAVAGDGDFVIVWVDKRSGNSDIYLQKYDPQGNPSGRNVKVNDDSSNAYQSVPALAVDLSGLYSVVWKDYRNGVYPFGPDIYFQRYDTSVTEVGDNRNLTSAWPDSLIESPDISLSMWGDGVVAWADYRNGNWDIYCQLFSAKGILIGDNFKINDDVGTAQQHAPRVSYSPEGWFVVAWYDNRTGDDDIFAQRFDSLGQKIDQNIIVNSDAGDYRQAFPDIAADGAGHFSVVWVDWRNGVYPANPDIYYRRFDTSMILLDAERKINYDGSLRAQREPSIAADRVGNLTVVWSDSTSSSWDITGQVLDNTGKFLGSNFRVNSEGDSAQLHPDITLDGRYRYVTWVDKRNGNYDIYASIVQYNDPNLIPDPSALRFEMEAGGTLPAAQTIAINHAGYNPLHYSVSASHDWLSISPLSGVTPDTLTITVNTDTLPFGTYFGAVTLIDTDFDDSTVAVSIRLDVTAPILSLSEDTLAFQAYALIDETHQQFLIIENDGSGEFTWQATETASWLMLSATSGAAPDTIAVAVNAASLAAGNYVESLVFEAAGAMASPDTVWVIIEVVNNMPYLGPKPDSFFIQTGLPETIDTFIVVQNEGVGLLNWSATVGDSWLRADRLSGLAGDTITLTIDTSSLERAQYATTVEIVDSAAFNVAVSVPFVLNYADSDTLLFNSVNTDSGATSLVPVELTLVNSMAALSLPVKFDPSAVNVDSIKFNESLPAYFNKTAQIDNNAGNILVNLARSEFDSLLGPGHYLLLEIHFTAVGNIGSSEIDTLLNESAAVYVLNERDQRVTPAVIPGTIRIDIPTAVDDQPPDGLPRKLALMQNYPNPFNISTNLSFELPVRTFVQLEVFNILGQNVNTLIERELSAGAYTVSWNGNFDSDRVASSGIYFYRLKTSSASLVRKMILVK